jgi:hypothetical protein
MIVNDGCRHRGGGHSYNRNLVTVTDGFFGVGVGRNRRGRREADDNGCKKQDNGSA